MVWDKRNDIRDNKKAWVCLFLFIPPLTDLGLPVQEDKQSCPKFPMEEDSVVEKRLDCMSVTLHNDHSVGMEVHCSATSGTSMHCKVSVFILNNSISIAVFASFGDAEVDFIHCG